MKTFEWKTGTFEKWITMKVSDFIYSKINLEDWEMLIKEQPKGMTDALKKINNGRGIEHQKVMDYIPKKYVIYFD